MSDFFTFSSKISLKPLESYPKEVRAKLPKVVAKNALTIQAITRISDENGGRTPVDLANLINSMLAEKKSGDGLEWEIHDGTDYGVHQELGTSRGIIAKHFLGGACEDQADKFFDEVKEALK